jgi:hypothetical protein
LLPEYVSAKYLEPFITNEVRENLLKSIIYEDISGNDAEGLPADNLVDICDIWHQAYQKGALIGKENALTTANRAYIVFKGFAKVGITALVDEATGYQDKRESDALQKILDRFLQDEKRKWSKTFPDEFWVKLLRIKGQPSYMALKRPSFVGHWVNDIVYSRLAPGIAKKLKDLNPRTEKGYRKNKHHQYFTNDQGVPELKEHLVKVMALIDASLTERDFTTLLNRSLPKYGDTIELNLDEPLQPQTNFDKSLKQAIDHNPKD